MHWLVVSTGVDQCNFGIYMPSQSLKTMEHNNIDVMLPDTNCAKKQFAVVVQLAVPTKKTTTMLTILASRVKFGHKEREREPVNQANLLNHWLATVLGSTHICGCSYCYYIIITLLYILYIYILYVTYVF